MDKTIKDELLALLEKARSGDATGNDYSRIAAIINTDRSGELVALADAFLGQEKLGPSRHLEPYDYAYWQQAFLEIKETYQQQHTAPGKVRRLPLVRYWWAAASILLLLTVGTYFLIKTNSLGQTEGTAEILPGKNGAVLTLADNSRIILDTIQNGIVTRQGGATAKIVNGTLMYEGGSGETVYNVLSTPRARKFHVVLPDGTEAWLNSASSIRYPTTFTGRERRITVTGEVYFEVARNEKMPFKLNVNNRAEIEVLGTHFNVKAYDNEPVINTTVMEGAIAISVSPHKTKPGKPEKKEKFILKPGQQAQILVDEKKLLLLNDASTDTTVKPASSPEMKTGVTVISNTDVEKVMAWKNGVFDFNNIAFNDAMYQLERWYNIEVVYEKGIPTDVELNGKISKDVSLNDVVTILEKIGVKCRLEGRKLLIQP